MSAPASPLERLVGFAGFLRANGFNAGVGEDLDALAVASRGGVADGRLLRWQLKSLFCSRRREWERFDGLFDAWFRPGRGRRSAGCAPATGEGGRGAAGGPGARPAAGGDGPDAAAAGGARGGASPREGIGGTDFRELADDTAMRAVEALAERLARRLRRRLMRRMELAGAGRRIHLRRTIRASLGRGGTPLDLVRVRRRRRPPRLALILDVSRSMSLYSFLFLRFARGLLGAFRDAEAFVFHTRLVRVSDALRERDLARAREKLALVSLGWSGGTRIGESLQRFNADHAGRILGRRAVVVIVSDGLDTGPPEVLGEALAAIRRRARRLVWLNPLLGRPGYRPLARGMRAALPHLDAFAPAHNLDSLAALETVLAS
jgi:uncharacterized protein with von Willebrand factor type A (vWA) domain